MIRTIANIIRVMDDSLFKLLDLKNLMKAKFFGIYLIIMISGFFLFIPSVRAFFIPAPFYLTPYSFIGLIITYFLCVFIDFVIIVLMVKYSPNGIYRLFYLVFLINLVPIPLSYTLATLVLTFIPEIAGPIVPIIFLLNMGAKTFLLRIEFKKHYKKNLILKPASLPLKKTLLISAITSTISFIVASIVLGNLLMNLDFGYYY